MNAARRRQRQPDPLASRAAIRTILADLRAALPEIIPQSDKDLLSLLRAVIHHERHPAARSRRGRKSRWSDHELTRSAQTLRRILARGTNRIGLRSFVVHYLLIPSFPADVAVALERGDVNLFEAEQLARLASHRTGTTETKLKKRRAALLRAHLISGESGSRLKARVDALLRAPSVTTDDLSNHHSPETLADDDTPADISPDHVFYEYLQIISAMMRELRPEEISDTAMERISRLSEGLIQQLNLVYKQQHPPSESPHLQQTGFHI